LSRNRLAIDYPIMERRPPVPGFTEAQLRVEHARKEGATTLDLAGHGLAELPAEIGSLNELWAIQFDDGQLTRHPEGD
jgi:hypothetical protein